MIDWQTLGSTLARKHHHVSLRTLAKILGTSASTLSRVEHGESCDADLFMSICQWLEMPAESFLEGKAPLNHVPASMNPLSDDWRFDTD